MLSQGRTLGHEPLTEPSLFDLLRGKRKHGEYLSHDLYHYIRHRRGQRDPLGVNMEAVDETCDAFKKVDKRVIACIDTNSCLVSSKELTYKRRVIRTERRTSMPTNITFAGWKGTWNGMGKSANYGGAWGLRGLMPLQGHQKTHG